MLSFILQAVGISLSGVVSPGPMTAATIASGTDDRHAGAYVALGHAVVEFPLMFAIFLFADFLKDCAVFKVVVGILGAVFMFYMGLSFVRVAEDGGASGAVKRLSPFLIGVVLSAGNPYFILWWATVGAALIFKAVSYGLLGFVLFAIFHWLCDLGWYWFLSFASYGGKELAGSRFYRFVNVFCGAFLILMGFKFLRDSFKLF
ncbi:MAG: LysE family transporter [Deferribacteres bacterium]|nr:LysE family transporter [Deferribacteres bacterium]